jgi:hypothetical protein
MKLVILYVILAFISFSAGACDTTTGPEEPDLPDAPFVWRVCNDSVDCSMNDIMIHVDRDSLVVGTLASEKCTEYFGTEYAIGWLRYDQKGEEYFYIYLESKTAVRGLVDSTLLMQSPGRYTYHFTRDTTMHFTRWVEIEREAYH